VGQRLCRGHGAPLISCICPGRPDTRGDQDKIVAEAITQALLEAGAKTVDFVYPDELVGKQPEITSVADGWREAEVYRQCKGSGAITEADLVTGLGLGEGLYRYLEEHSEYTSVFADVAGWNMKRALGKHAHKFRGFYSTNTWEEFLLRTQGFPDEVWKELENQVIGAVGKKLRLPGDFICGYRCPGKLYHRTNHVI